METIKNLRVNLENKILQSKKVVIVPHINIDLDAIGSAIGLSLVVSHLNKKASILIEEPQMYRIDRSVKNVIEVAKNKYNVINKETFLKEKDESDLVLLTDVNKPELICLKEEIKNVDKDNIFIIDHHDKGTTTIQTDNCYIDTTSCSACEIVTNLLCNFKIKIPAEVANYLLAGIYLDTGRLTKNTRPETHKLVAKLMEKGANNAVIDEWFQEDFEMHQRVLKLVSKAMIHKYSYAIVEADKTCEYTKEELAKVADFLLRYGVDAAFSIGNIEENLISISARSKEKVYNRQGDKMFNFKEIEFMKIYISLMYKYGYCYMDLSKEYLDDYIQQLRKLIDPPYLYK